MNKRTFPSRAKIPPDRIGVSEFRAGLAGYLLKAKEEPGHTIYIGSSKDTLCMSPETLKRLETCHSICIWARKAYDSLELDSLMTLSTGIRTRHLPEDVNRALAAFFQLIREAMDIAVASNGANRLAGWEVTELVQTALQGKKPPAHARFQGIYTVINDLFVPDVFQSEDIRSGEFVLLNRFFERIGSVSFDERSVSSAEASCLRNWTLSDEQRKMIGNMLFEFSVWVRHIIWLGPDMDLYGSAVKQIETQYETLKEQYRENIGDVPPVSFFPV